MSPYRLVTRSDFDGLVCAVLLRKLGLVDEIVFVHPRDVQDGTFEVTGRDILTNLPHAPAAHLVFDHHLSEAHRAAHRTDGPVNGERANHVLVPQAPSAARVVFDHYGGRGTFPDVSDDLMAAVDAADSADYALEDILGPSGWTLVNFVMDSRTGLGRFRDFRVSNYELMMNLIEHCSRHQDVEEILAIPDVAERVALYRAERPRFVEQLRRVTTRRGDVAVVDLRAEEVIHAGNRFMVYALYPAARVSVHVLRGRENRNTVFAVGKSILDRSSPVDVGAIMLRHGGGGHRAAGTCQVEHSESERVLAEVIDQLITDARTAENAQV